MRSVALSALLAVAVSSVSAADEIPKQTFKVRHYPAFLLEPHRASVLTLSLLPAYFHQGPLP